MMHCLGARPCGGRKSNRTYHLLVLIFRTSSRAQAQEGLKPNQSDQQASLLWECSSHGNSVLSFTWVSLILWVWCCVTYQVVVTNDAHPLRGLHNKDVFLSYPTSPSRARCSSAHVTLTLRTQDDIAASSWDFKSCYGGGGKHSKLHIIFAPFHWP